MKIKSYSVILCLMLAAVSSLAQTAETYSFTNINKVVPDGNASGVSSATDISSSMSTITGVKVKLNLAGEFNGDLYVYVRHLTATSTNMCVLLNRPGRTPGNSSGYGDSGINVTFDQSAANGDIHLYRLMQTPADGSPLTGIWQPDGRNSDPFSVLDTTARNTSLTNFNGMNPSGEWTLFVADLEAGATNMLASWELQIIGPVAPTIAWTAPDDIIYGAALGASQLDATPSVAGSLVYSPAAGTILNAGSSQQINVTFTPTDTTNYAVVTTNVLINVLKAPLTIAANNTNKVYGTSVPTFTASYTGFVNGDTTSKLTTQATLSSTANSSSPIGNYPITVSGAAASNYSIAYVSGTLANTPASLTIAANNTNKVYGASTPTLTASYVGFVNGDTATMFTTQATLSTTATASSPIGNYPITVSGAVYSNYSIAYVSGTLANTPASLTIAANNTNKVYGASTPTLTASYVGFVNGDTTNRLTTQATLSTTANSSSPIGNYPITVNGAVSSNYSIAYVSGTLANTPASLTIAANNTNKVYGASTPTLTASYVGFVNGDTTSKLTTQATLSTTATASSPIGNYPITVSGAVYSNYSIAFVSGTLANTPAPLTIAANNTNKVYGASTPTLTASYVGFVNGDTTSKLTTQATLSTTATASSPVGNYPITVSGAVYSNYSIAFVPGSLTIYTAQTIGLLTSSATRVQSGQPVTFTYQVSAVAPGAGTRTGAVQFKTNNVAAGAPVTLSGGQAAYVTASLPKGKTTIIAEYPGDSNFIGSTNSLEQAVNNAPTAAPVYLTQSLTNGVKTQISNLLTLANATDADGDVLSISAISSTSTNSGTIVTNQGWVQYHPFNSSTTNTDAFTYTISDGQGATITNWVILAPPQSLPSTASLTMLRGPNGTWVVRLNGIPALTYRLQSNTDLAMPNWQNCATNTADANGIFYYSVPTNSVNTYFRSVFP